MSTRKLSDFAIYGPYVGPSTGVWRSYFAEIIHPEKEVVIRKVSGDSRSETMKKARLERRELAKNWKG